MHDGSPQVDIEHLVHEHHADVYRYARRLCGQVADAEDLVQQAFLSAQRKLDQLREPCKARAWLLAITRNCFLKSCRKRRPQASSALEFDLDQIPLPAEDSAVDADALQEAVQELPEEFRVVVLMFYFEFLSYREIAQQLDVPIGTVMSRLARAKKYLRQRLVAQGRAAVERSPHLTFPSTLDPDVSLKDSNA